MAPDASTSPVDWSRPIEAVHEDGRVVSCSFVEDDGTSFLPVQVHGVPIDGPACHYTEGFFGKDGTRQHSKWRIRNVQPTTPERDPALWDRMVGLVRLIGEHSLQTFVYSGDATTLNGWIVEARALLADLPKPVDPDLIEARKLCADIRNEYAEGFLSGEYDTSSTEIPVAMAALRRGRELAGEQA